MSFQTILRTALTAIVACTAVTAAAAEPDALDIRDAKAILKVLLSEVRSIDRCGIYPSWTAYPNWFGANIPADVARIFLDIETDQGIKPPNPALRFETIVDPGPIGAAAFCDAAAEDAYAAELAKVDPKGDVWFTTNAFSFPVFNKEHTQAVVLQNSFFLVWRRDGDKIERSHGGGDGNAVVLSKENGTWKVIMQRRTWVT